MKAKAELLKSKLLKWVPTRDEWIDYLALAISLTFWGWAMQQDGKSLFPPLEDEWSMSFWIGFALGSMVVVTVIQVVFVEVIDFFLELPLAFRVWLGGLALLAWALNQIGKEVRLMDWWPFIVILILGVVIGGIVAAVQNARQSK